MAAAYMMFLISRVMEISGRPAKLVLASCNGFNSSAFFGRKQHNNYYIFLSRCWRTFTWLVRRA